jgi:hypothetical protein
MPEAGGLDAGRSAGAEWCTAEDDARAFGVRAIYRRFPWPLSERIPWPGDTGWRIDSGDKSPHSKRFTTGSAVRLEKPYGWPCDGIRHPRRAHPTDSLYAKY